MITAIWLRSVDGKAQMLAEIDRVWYLMAEEILDGGPFSHIVERTGFAGKPVDRVTS